MYLVLDGGDLYEVRGEGDIFLFLVCERTLSGWEKGFFVLFWSFRFLSSFPSYWLPGLSRLPRMYFLVFPPIFSIKSKRIFQDWSLNNFWSIRNLSCFSLRPFPAPNFFSPLFLQLPHISGDVILNEMYSQIVEKKRALGMMEKRKKGKTNAPFFSSFLFSYHIR